jgi:hypothetical protein
MSSYIKADEKNSTPAELCSRDESLVRLLTAATATFDSDRDRAKACVQEAVDLLRLSLERAGIFGMRRLREVAWPLGKRNVSPATSIRTSSAASAFQTSPASCN